MEAMILAAALVAILQLLTMALVRILRWPLELALLSQIVILLVLIVYLSP